MAKNLLLLWRKTVIKYSNRQGRQYNLTGHDYVVHNAKVNIPQMSVNSDVPIIGHNIVPGDPRNYNLKKHMVRLSLYELTKTIAPNNVSTIRMRDYEDSMKWLNDPSKLRLSPHPPPANSRRTNNPSQIGNSPHSKPITIHTKILGWCKNSSKQLLCPLFY